MEDSRNEWPDANRGGVSARKIPAYVTTVRAFRACTFNDDGRTRKRELYVNRDLAVQSVKGQGGWGSNGSVDVITMTVVVYRDPNTGEEMMQEVGSTVKIEFVDADEARARALAKLDPADRLALGLK